MTIALIALLVCLVGVTGYLLGRYDAYYEDLREKALGKKDDT